MIKEKMTMLNTVKKLIDSNISAAELYRETGVADSIIKRLRLGKQDYDQMRYYNLKKLYDYQLHLEEQKVKEDNYEEYLNAYEKLKETEDFKEKYEQLTDINSDLGKKLRNILKSLGITEENYHDAFKEATEEDVEQLYRYIDLLLKTSS